MSEASSILPNRAGVAVRECGPGDGPLLRHLAGRCRPLGVHTPYTYAALVFVQPSGCLVAEVCGEPVGFATTLHAVDSLFLWQLGVLPEWRGTGVAGLLLLAVGRRMRNAGLRAVTATVDPGNTPCLAALRAFATAVDAPFRKVPGNSGFPAGETLYRIGD